MGANTLRENACEFERPHEVRFAITIKPLGITEPGTHTLLGKLQEFCNLQLTTEPARTAEREFPASGAPS